MIRRTFLKHSLKYLATWGALFTIPESVVSEIENSLRSLYQRSGSQVDWEHVRQQMLLDPKIAYLNTGTLGACPRPVFQTTLETWKQLEGNPAIRGFRTLLPLAEQTRERAADLLKADTGEIALMQNTTEGLNLVACALQFKPGDEILITNHEHPGGRVGWEYLEKYHQIRITRIDLDHQFLSADEIVEKFRRRITRNTRVLSVAHVLYTTGLKMPIRQLSHLAHEHGLLMVVDGAQVPGMLRVDLKHLACDVYASSSHKWLLAPKGTGLLYIRREVQDQLRPVSLEGGFHAYSGHIGTRNVPALIGHGTAILWHQSLGEDQVEKRVLELSRYCYRRLQAFKRLRFLRPLDPELDSGMVAFSPLDIKNVELARKLEEQHIIVKIVPKLNGIRISTHVYNREKDIDRLVEALHAAGIR